jgi:nitrous oxidase accessory protein NosD
VSGVGDDANPCSRTAPCKTFAGAISKTAAGGQINCLDPGGFGSVTITKSISIQCDHTEGGLLVSMANGVVINAAANDTVLLSGLDIYGAGNGTNGIRFVGGAKLVVRNSVIRMFKGAPGAAISFVPTGAAQLIILDSVIADNERGVEVGGQGSAVIERSTITGSNAAGIATTGAGSRIWVSDSLISANGTGISAFAGSTISSFGNNRLAGNSKDGSFTGKAAAQ